MLSSAFVRLFVCVVSRITQKPIFLHNLVESLQARQDPLELMTIRSRYFMVGVGVIALINRTHILTLPL